MEDLEESDASSHDISPDKSSVTASPRLTHGYGEFDSISDAITTFAKGEFILMLDSTNRENEGDLMIPAEDITTEKMAFLVRHSSGFICAPIEQTRADHLNLPRMISITESTDPHGTAYTVSIDAQCEAVTTGISAHDRALTCRLLANDTSDKNSFRRPGHILPLIARPEGILARQGHTEACIEMCRLAGKNPVGVIAEVLSHGRHIPGKAEMTGGGMMRRDACVAFARRWGIKVVTVEQLTNFLKQKNAQEYVKHVLN